MLSPSYTLLGGLGRSEGREEQGSGMHGKSMETSESDHQPGNFFGFIFFEKSWGFGVACGVECS